METESWRQAAKEGGTMLPRKWQNMERQRPQLKLVKWGTLTGLVLTVAGAVGIGSWLLGLLIMAGFGFWGYRVLNR